ncbi:MAG: amino acid adenylation domain-containing protein, partial [bacterium]|nr:amino acid adenylation domain-containing protein [bacterium]
QLFLEQVERTPDNTALIGIRCRRRDPGNVANYEDLDTETPGHLMNPGQSAMNSTLTYKALNEKTDRLARQLMDAKLEPSGIAAIMVERSVEMIVGLLAILKTGASYLPIEPGYPGERITYMLKESNATLLLTTGTIPATITFDKEVVYLDRLYEEKKQTTEVDTQFTANKKNLDRRNSTSGTAYIIYTSGTTGKPKGVMVEHRNVVNVVSWFAEKYQIKTGTNVVQMSKCVFDASVNQIFGTLLYGGTLYLPREEILGDIEAMRLYIDVNRINIINFVPSFLKELLGNSEKLASLYYVLSGADNLDEKTKGKLLAKGYRLYNQYGPTETTIDALVAECSEQPVNLGTPISNARCYILDRYNHLLPVGLSGQLCISGAGVARGYLNRPELTAEKFVTNPFTTTENNQLHAVDNRNPITGELLYYSGDLARWLENGNIEFLGRIDHQVKVRGFRIELGEIETQLLKHEIVKETVVVAIEGNNGEKTLCAYYVSEKDTTLRYLQAREFLAATLPDYMVPSYFVPMEKIPLTPNGKIDRKALPGPEVDKTCTGYVAPTNRIEEKMVDIWSEVMELEKEKIGIYSNFFEIGGHSLKATLLMPRIHREFHVKISVGELFKTPTIKGLSKIIETKDKSRYLSIEPVEKKEYYPVPSMHQRMVLDTEFEKTTRYNTPRAFEVRGKFNLKGFEKAIGKLIMRHEIFRTSFHRLNGKVVQRIKETAELKPVFEKCTLQHALKRVETQAFLTPFDLSRTPLFRVEILQVDEEIHYILTDMHHILTDTTSNNIWLNDVVTLYAGLELDPLKIQFKDYSIAQAKLLVPEETARLKGYWLDKLRDLKITRLPYDKTDNFDGNKFGTDIQHFDETLCRKINSFCSEYDLTRFSLIIALLQIIIAHETNQNDVSVGVRLSKREFTE